MGGLNDAGGGRRRSGGVKLMVAPLWVLLIVTMAARMAEAQTSCSTIIKTQSTCTTSGGGPITVACPSYYGFQVISAVLYRLASTTSSCSPTAPPTNPTAIGACQQDTLASQCGAYSTTISSCQIQPTWPPSAPTGSCSGTDYFLLVSYRCNPVFQGPSSSTPSTGSSIVLDSNATVSNAAVSFGALSVYTTTSFCSIYVPAGLELTIAATYYYKTPSSGVQCSAGSVLVSDLSGQTVAQFCNSTLPPKVTLACGADRFLRLDFSNTDPTVKSMFSIQFTVPAGAAVTAQCGTPPFPLIIPTTAPVSVTTATTSTAVVPTTAAAGATTTALAAATTASGVQPRPTTNNAPPVPIVDPGTTTGTAPAAVTSAAPVMTSASAAVSGMSQVSAGGQSSSGGSSGWSDSATVGVVVGCVIAAAIVMVAITIGVCYRWRQTMLSKPHAAAAAKVPQPEPAAPSEPPPKSANYQLDPRSNNNGQFRNVTGFYVDGNSTSKLVINRPQEPKIFKTILRL